MDIIKELSNNINIKIQKFNEIYLSCCEKIIEVDKYGFKDLLYTIPINVEYNINECREYIENLLREKGFSIYTISNHQFFITWHSLLPSIQ